MSPPNPRRRMAVTRRNILRITDEITKAPPQTTEQVAELATRLKVNPARIVQVIKSLGLSIERQNPEQERARILSKLTPELFNQIAHVLEKYQPRFIRLAYHYLWSGIEIETLYDACLDRSIIRAINFDQQRFPDARIENRIIDGWPSAMQSAWAAYMARNRHRAIRFSENPETYEQLLRGGIKNQEESKPSVLNTVAKRQQLRLLHDAMETLTRDEQLALIHRFELNGAPILTYREIAETYGGSHNKWMLVERRALARLRSFKGLRE